jgi:molybdopterin converting factor small subunit
VITVKVVAPFRLKQATPEGEIQVPEGTTLRRMLRLSGAPLIAQAWPVMVNGWQQNKSYKLQDGDLVVFVVPIAGG